MPAGASNAFAAELRRGLYEAIFRRRDIREFLPDPIPGEVLARVIIAAHHAASVGFTQPWDFILVRDLERRREVKRIFEEERQRNAAQFAGRRREKFLSLKLEGILEAPLNLIVTCKPDRFGPGVLGKVSIADVEVYSACLAVENLWLAARAEGLGMGWVSILRNDVLREIFGIPEDVIPVAYLCLGYVKDFPERPILESAEWARRLPPRELLHFDSWNVRDGPAHGLAQEIEDAAIWREIFPDDLPPDRSLNQVEFTRTGHRRYSPGRFGRIGGRAPTAEFAYQTARQSRAPEEIVCSYAAIRRDPSARFGGGTIAVFVADHGIADEGVSAYPKAVTLQMLANIARGGAAISVLARHFGFGLQVIDVGVETDTSISIDPLEGVRYRRVGPGTRSFLHGPAMSRGEAVRAIEVGIEVANDAAASDATLLGIGEMGIANSTSAAAILAATTGASPERIVGRGTGLDDAQLGHKVNVVRDARALHASSLRDPIARLAALGGFEIAAMAGACLGGAARRIPVVVDGYIATAAAAIACELHPTLRDYLFFAHRSSERGHSIALEHLGARPILDLDMRLGEGTGAALAMSLIRAALDVFHKMATFTAAGVSEKIG